MQRDKNTPTQPWRRGLVTDLVIHLVLEVTVVSGVDHLLKNTAASLVIGILLVEGAQHLLRSTHSLPTHID
jgi:hypothetical protein